MKSITQVKEENKRFQKLINAVVSRIGKESIEDVNRLGIDAGFNGFIYYADTHKFAMFYRKQIIALLTETSDSLSENVYSLVNSFGVFGESGMDDDEQKDFYKYMGGGRPEQGAITNVMAWFAAEEVCRMFDE